MVSSIKQEADKYIFPLLKLCTFSTFGHNHSYINRETAIAGGTNPTFSLWELHPLSQEWWREF